MQDFLGDVCVAFFNVSPGNKDAVTPSRKKKAVVFTNVTANTYQGRLNTGFSKFLCEIFKVHGIESLKYIREFHSLKLLCCCYCYCGDISTPRNVTLNKTDCDWLFDM